MPYKVVKMGSRFAVVKKAGGKVVGTHASKAAANKQLAALYAREKK